MAVSYCVRETMLVKSHEGDYLTPEVLWPPTPVLSMVEQSRAAQRPLARATFLCLWCDSHENQV